MRIRSALAVTGSLLLLGAVTDVAPASQSESIAALRGSLRTELNRYLTTRRVAEHISALGLAVTFRDSRPAINLAVGRVRYVGGRRISPYALWQIGSNTKAFTSVLLLQLEAQHKLSINDTVGKWLPQYRSWRRVTIRRLLNMTSGIPELETQEWVRAYVAAPDQVFSAPWLVSYALGLPPTTGYSYSNTNYILAQMIVERAGHESFDSQMRKRIIVPLGLHNTFYSSTVYPRAVTARLPGGYFAIHGWPGTEPLLGTDQSRHNVSWGQGAGGIISSLQDLAKWARALYTGRLLPSKQQHELESLVSEKTGKPIQRTTSEDPSGFGLGVAQNTAAAFGGVNWNYNGEMLGFRVSHLYLPRSGTIITLGFNSSSDETSALIGLLTSVYRVLHRAGLS